MDLWVREARLFKYGSGTGSNFSKLRGEGERLSGGGTLLRPDELPQDRRPRGGRHQIGRHDAPGRQDGHGRPRPSRHRDPISTGRWSRSRRWRPWSPAPSSPRSISTPSSRPASAETGEGRLDPKQNKALRKAIRAARECHDPRELYPPGDRSSREQGYDRIDFRTYDTDWDSDAYLTVSGQNSNNSVRIPNDFIRRCRPTANGTSTGAPTARSPRPCRPASSGRRSPTPPGPAPIRACSTTPPSTSGIPARRAVGSTPPIPARNTCSWTTRPAIWRRLNLMTFRQADGGFDIASYRACRPALDHRARDLRADGAVPFARDRPALLRVPHPGPGLRQYRRAADDHGPGLRQRGGPRLHRRPDRDHDRRVLCHLGRDGGRARRFPGYERNREAMLRVIRNHRRAAYGFTGGYEGLATMPVPLDAANCPEAEPGHRGQAGLGPAR